MGRISQNPLHTFLGGSPPDTAGLASEPQAQDCASPLTMPRKVFGPDFQFLGCKGGTWREELAGFLNAFLQSLGVSAERSFRARPLLKGRKAEGKVEAPAAAAAASVSMDAPGSPAEAAGQQVSMALCAKYGHMSLWQAWGLRAPFCVQREERE